MATPIKICQSCQKVLQGRADKKFCDPYCKSAFHYKKNQEGTNNLYSRIDKQLKKNRSILKNYNKAGKSIVRTEILIQQGFDPNFFTHYWKNQKGDIYLFAYEFGFLLKKENQKNKYLLVKWQPYMNKTGL